MKNISLRLPDYEVLIDIKVNEFSKHLEKEIESLTAAYDLEESTISHPTDFGDTGGL